MIKAIETIYNGYKFRSRLEARWAVFFDILGLTYEYEPEGFSLDNGMWYLPDFYITNICPKTWVEIKPNYRELSVEEIQKAKWLCDGLRENVLIISGNPWPNEYSCQLFFSIETIEKCNYCGNLSNDPDDLLKCSKCGNKFCYTGCPFDYEVYGPLTGCFYQDDNELSGKSLILRTNNNEFIQAIRHFGLPKHNNYLYVWFITGLDRIEFAYIAARQARFEHRNRGHNGKTKTQTGQTGL